MTSSAYSLSAFYPMAQFELLSGTLEPGALHGPSRHMYCPHCKSWVYTRPEAMDDFVNVRSPMIDGDPFGKPFIETVVGEALPWARLNAVHEFEGFPPRESFPALIAEFQSREECKV
jgi:hypothetical protein